MKLKKCKLSRKEKGIVLFGFSSMLNIILASLLAVSLTYGAAFGGQYSLGINKLTPKTVILMLDEKGLISYWVVSSETVGQPKDDKLISWEINGNIYWASRNLVGIEVRNPDKLNYKELSDKYGVSPEEIESIKKKLE